MATTRSDTSVACRRSGFEAAGFRAARSSHTWVGLQTPCAALKIGPMFLWGLSLDQSAWALKKKGCGVNFCTAYITISTHISTAKQKKNSPYSLSTDRTCKLINAGVAGRGVA